MRQSRPDTSRAAERNRLQDFSQPRLSDTKGAPPSLAASSMKIARPRRQLAEQRALVAQSSRNQMHDLAGPLQRAVDGEQVGAQQLLALALGQVPPHDDVDHAGLVFERDESNTACRARTLPAGNQPGHARDAAMRQLA